VAHINDPLAFARAKLISFASWLFPRRISPTDIDMAIERNGHFLFAEYKTASADWSRVPTGQRIFFEELVKLGQGKVWAACCKHRVPEDGAMIDSKWDVTAFQLMAWSDGGIKYTSRQPGHHWPGFVSWWFEEADKDPLPGR
jgi:hypothetical protein